MTVVIMAGHDGSALRQEVPADTWSLLLIQAMKVVPQGITLATCSMLVKFVHITTLTLYQLFSTGSISDLPECSMPS